MIDVHGFAYAETPISQEQIVFHHYDDRPSQLLEYRIDAAEGVPPGSFLRLHVNRETNENAIQIVKFPFRNLDSGKTELFTLGNESSGANDYRCTITN